MKALSHFLAVLLALALLAAIGLGAYLGVEFVSATFVGLAVWVQAAALAAAVLLLGAAWVAGAIRRAGRDRLAVPLREERAATYRLLVDVWQQRLRQTAGVGEPWPAGLAEELRSLDILLGLCGSAALIEWQGRLRALERQHGPAHLPLRSLLVEAMAQMRTELQAGRVAAPGLEQLLWQEAAPPLAKALPAASPQGDAPAAALSVL